MAKPYYAERYSASASLRFTSSQVDPRSVTMPRHRIAGLSASEIERIHGRIVPMHPARRGFLARLFGR